VEVSLTHFLGGALRVRQPARGYRFNVDSVLLARFAGTLDGERVLDLGAGTGILLLLAGHFGHPSRLCGVEIQEALADLCRENLAENGWDDRSEAVAADLRSPGAFPEGAWDLVVANPPYHGAGRSQACADPAKDTARRDASLAPGELFAAAARALAPRGRFCFLMPAPRREELSEALAHSGLHVRVCQAVRPDGASPAHLHLIQARREPGRGPLVLPDLPLRVAPREYQPEVARYLRGERGAAPRFFADVMVGRLAKALRLLGYDAAYDRRAEDGWLLHESARTGRVLLTRDRALLAAAAKRRTEAFDPGDDAVLRQLEAVRERYGGPPGEGRPRCLCCNRPPEELERERARGRVPAYTWLTHDRFRACPGCGTLTWEGSHLERFRARIAGGPERGARRDVDERGGRCRTSGNG